MRHNIWLVIVLLFISSFTPPSFKEEQLRYPREREAYQKKEKNVLRLLHDKGIGIGQLEICLQVFKQEKQLELWAKNKRDTAFQLLKTYAICASSGELGPKRQRGDYQIPEGFYGIDRFNPHSTFFLSLGINYPNYSDRILGKKGRLGGDIFIHGSCVTIGCMPITDPEIMELYLMAVEAKNNGQERISVTIYPCNLEKDNFFQLLQKHKNDQDKIHLWTDLEKGFQYFRTHKKLPQVKFLPSGRHQL